MSNRLVFDTSAILAFTSGEPGRLEVFAHVTEAIDGRARIYASFVSLTVVRLGQLR